MKKKPPKRSRLLFYPLSVKHVLRAIWVNLGIAGFLVTDAGPASAQTLTVTWSANREADLGGYKVYWGPASRIYPQAMDVGLETEAVFTRVPDSVNVFFAVTAYDTLGNESAFSAEAVLWNEKPSFLMHDNYPNPFNPATVIPYSIKQVGTIEMNIYDLLGRFVKTLEQGEKPAGDYVTVWDGTGAGGQQVPNGVYFCTLEFGGFRQTKKLILAR